MQLKESFNDEIIKRGLISKGMDMHELTDKIKELQRTNSENQKKLYYEKDTDTKLELQKAKLDIEREKSDLKNVYSVGDFEQAGFYRAFPMERKAIVEKLERTAYKQPSVEEVDESLKYFKDCLDEDILEETDSQTFKRLNTLIDNLK